MNEIACVSEVVVVGGEVEVRADLDQLTTQLKELEIGDLFKVLKAALAEAEKKAKSGAKVSKKAHPKVKVAKKAGSMPKGVVPPQLRKNRAWVKFTLMAAQTNGWESFTVHQTKLNKATGVTEEEEITMPCSIVHEGVHVYDGSVNEKKPKGKQFIPKDAMSLSSERWTPKVSAGSNEASYNEFLSSYVDEPVEPKEKVEKVLIVRKTVAEKEAEKVSKALVTKTEKVQKAEQKEVEKQEMAEQKALAKAAVAAEKLAEKAEKQKSVKPAKKEKVEKEVSTPTKVEPKKVASIPQAPMKNKAAKGLVWSCPSDGLVHPWSFKGLNYLRNYDNEVWRVGVDGGMGDWSGVYLVEEERLDDSVEEPEFE